MFALGNLASAVAGAVVAGLLAYVLGHAIGEHKGYQRHAAEMAIADGKAWVKRSGDDAMLRSMSDYDLCVVGLRGNGMPVDACEQLRGVPAGEP